MYAIILIERSQDHEEQLNSNRNQVNKIKIKTLNSQINILTDRVNSNLKKKIKGDRKLAHFLGFGSTSARSESNPCIHLHIIIDPKSKPLDSDLN